VIGSLVRQRAAIVERIVTEGHEVGNHSWAHPRFASECDDGRVHDELARTNEVLKDVLGFWQTRFWAPRYNVDERVRAIAATLGLVHTRGDVAPPDYDVRATAAFLATFVLQQVEPGDVIGLHDGRASRQARQRRQQGGHGRGRRDDRATTAGASLRARH
jgi:peptidoglycan/xylan/chitin deacetylase (PgdA/CDA1 family)